jgi:hypothetical protein
MVGANLYGVIIEAVLELWTERYDTGILSRLQRMSHVTGTQYDSTGRVQRDSLNLGGNTDGIYSP